MHAWPPMSSAFTRCFRKIERTLPIGFGIKRASQRQERGPQLARFQEPLGGSQAPPRQRLGIVGGFITRRRVNHTKDTTRTNGSYSMPATASTSAPKRKSAARSGNSRRSPCHIATVPTYIKRALLRAESRGKRQQAAASCTVTLPTRWPAVAR